MRIIADESVDKQIVVDLRKNGHNITYIADVMPGVSDEQVLETARNKKAVLLTSDKDFGELVFRRKLIHNGIILIRLSGLNQCEKSNIVISMINKYGKIIKSGFTVITPRSIRYRKSNL